MAEIIAVPVPLEAAVADARVLDNHRVRLGATLTALGWISGDKLAIEVAASGLVTVSRWPGGSVRSTMLRLDGQGRITLPRWVRDLTGLEGRSPVLVAVAVGGDCLVLASPAVILRLNSTLGEDSL